MCNVIVPQKDIDILKKSYDLLWKIHNAYTENYNDHEKTTAVIHMQEITGPLWQITNRKYPVLESNDG